MDNISNLINKNKDSISKNISKGSVDIDQLVNKIDKLTTLATKYLDLIEKYKFMIYYYFGFIFFICFTSIYVNSILLTKASVIFMIIYIILILGGLIGIYISWIIINRTIKTGKIEPTISEKEIVDIF